MQKKISKTEQEFIESMNNSHAGYMTADERDELLALQETVGRKEALRTWRVWRRDRYVFGLDDDQTLPYE